MKNQARDDEDLIDLATAETFLTGGTIYPLESERMAGSRWFLRYSGIELPKFIPDR